ncbi:MAG: trypsin-like peptidase domain-containing protein [Labilibaculum sp.]|nr:trypsin-like peptidase domain-containing protein [Labilibaculum sp.]MBI9057216.1 trypsin-like peptidase domain-containing protein [Labilibaculum sp.]
MKIIRIIFLLAFVFIGSLSQVLASEKSVKEDFNKLINIQNQIKKIYPQILDCTVSIGAGCSGVIVSEDGYILTASHVIEMFENTKGKITVKLKDGIERDVERFGRNMAGDFALLKLKDEGKWPFAKIGSSSELNSNELCLMLGHSTGYQEGRPAVLRTGFVRGFTKTGFLRTSCTMMPGDLGGPLFNLDGELIGINSYCWEKEFENYFSPSDRILKNWDALLDGGVHEPKHPNYYSKEIVKANLADSPYVLSKSYDNLSLAIEGNGSTKSNKVYPIYLLNDDDQLIIHATQITNDGVLVSKSSLIKEKAVRCKLKDGTFVRLEVIGRSDENDLVYLHSKEIANENQLLIKNKIEIGDFIGLLNVNNEIDLSGVIGVGTRNIPVLTAGMFGMEMEGLKVTKVYDNSNSFLGGIKDGDEIISINSKVFKNKDEYDVFMKNTCPNQIVDLQIKRGDKEVETEVKLGPFPPKQHPADFVELSGKKEGFANAFTFDISIKPVDCGAPLLNLDGEVVGVSIARSTRTCSYAIPIDVILNEYNKLSKKMN